MGIFKDRLYVSRSRKKTKQMKKSLVKKVTDKNFVTKYGKKDLNKAMDSGAIFNPYQSRYKKVRKEVKKKYKHL